MPKTNGLELIGVLAAKNTPNRCRVIVVTGDLRESQCDEALKRGAYGLLTKPFATGIGMAPTVLCDFLVVLLDVVSNFADLGQALRCDRAIRTCNFLFRDEFFAITKTAMRGAGQCDID